jgi:enoyl-CoA hydratase/carnithine racemase
MSETPSTEVILTEQRGRALWIFINREARRNAINPDVITGSRDGLDGLP